jgi:thymidylate kinase
MLFVHVDIETAIERNRARGEAGGRSLRDRTIEKNWQGVHENEQPYRQLFGDNFFYVDAADLNDNQIEDIRTKIKRFTL